MKTFTLTLLLSSLLLAACSGDDTPDPDPSILGKWKPVKSTFIETTYSGSTAVSTDTNTIVGAPLDYWEFKESLLITYDQQHDAADTTNYHYSGNTLFIADIKCSITHLTDSTLHFNYADTTQLTGNQYEVTKGYIELKK